MTSIPKELQALTKKQKDFVLEYAKTGNGTQSMKKAGYKGSAKTLGAEAVENLAKPSIQAALKALIDPALEKQFVTTERVIEEVAKYAFEEPSKVLSHKDKRGYLQMAGDYTEAWKGAKNPFGDGIKSIRVIYK